MKNKKFRLGNAGASLPLVLCVIAFLIAFGLALTYAASLLLARTNVKIEEQRCYQLARSFATQLDAQLTDTTNTSGTGGSGADTSFKTFVNQFLNNGQYIDYKEETGNGVYTYETSGEADGYGTITVKLYKETAMTSDDLSAANGELSTSTVSAEDGSTGDYSNAVNDIESKTFDRYTVTVEVIAAYDDLTYSYKTEYDRVDTYQVVFMIGDKQVVWNGDVSGRGWHVGTKDSAAIMSLDGVASISYTYQTSSEPLTVTYEPVHAEYTAAEEAAP